MGKPITLPWSAARWRQDTYAPRVTKVHDPVSGMALHPVGLLAMQLRAGGGIDALTGDDVACQGCGYHVCSCKPVSGSYAALMTWACAPIPQFALDIMSCGCPAGSGHGSHCLHKHGAHT